MHEMPKNRLFEGEDPEQYSQIIEKLFALRVEWPAYRDDELLIKLLLSKEGDDQRV